MTAQRSPRSQRCTDLSTEGRLSPTTCWPRPPTLMPIKGFNAMVAKIVDGPYIQVRHRVVIIGGGFGGLTAAKQLRRANVDVTLIDRTNHHLFQPCSTNSPRNPLRGRHRPAVA